MKSGSRAEIQMENGNGHHKSFVFDEFSLEVELQTLRRGGKDVHLAKRPFSVLTFLIENRERVVSREELLEKFWNGHEVYDDALRKCVSAIRKALDDTEKSPRFVETRRGSGYRFVGKIRENETNGNKPEKEVEPKSPLPENKIFSEAKTANFKSRDENQPEISDLKSQIEEKITIGEIERNTIQTTSDKIQNQSFGFQNRKIFLSILIVILIASAAFAFFSSRSQPKNVTAKNLTEIVAAKRSIAILPLKNLTGDARNDYLSDGITESLINEVSRVESLKVISRSSAFQFKNENATAQEIGEKLGVETILEGSLKQSGELLRVEVRLVNTKDGSVVWASDSEQKKLADIFAIQDGIACQIVTELKVKLCGDVAPAARYTKNVKAYQLYLQGMYHRNRLGAEDLKRAVEYFEQALKIDPHYALAHEGLASTYTVMELNATVPPKSVAALAEKHAVEALKIDDNLTGAYLALGVVKTLDNYDLATREKYYRQGLLKNPNHRTARLWLANNYTVQGKFAEAEQEILRAQEIDPLSMGVHLTLAELYWYWKKPDKVIEQANLLLAANLNDGNAHSLLARAYLQENDFEKALAELEKLPNDNLMRAGILAADGRMDEARKYGEEFINSADGKNSPYKVAVTYAILGEKEQALNWLEKSYEMRQADLISIKIDPAFENLHDDARFQNLLQLVHLAD